MEACRGRFDYRLRSVLPMALILCDMLRNTSDRRAADRRL
jgi:hypothetical protein